MTGTVKWFNAAKGFGFITTEVGDDVFVFLKPPNYLTEGAKVVFDLITGPKGKQATNVRQI